jgi:hypothetical protein
MGEISLGCGLPVCEDFSQTTAMGDVVCADCETLQQAALEATIRHFRAESSLAIAKLAQDSRKIRALEPLVESLFQARSAAVRAYQEHIATHTQKSAQGGA